MRSWLARLRGAAGADASPGEPEAPLLAAVCRYLMERSYEYRFDDPRRSLELARSAARVGESLEGDDSLPETALHDLLAEVESYLGNALRINSDLGAAGAALRRAEAHRVRGSGDPRLEADLLGRRASLLFDLGKTEQAARLIDRVIRLHEEQGMTDRLGDDLIDRGVLGAWVDSLDSASESLRRGVELVSSPRRMALALGALAEALARAGYGAQSLQVLEPADEILSMLGDRGLRLRLRWIRGVALRALGRLEEAEAELAAVCAALDEQGQILKAASASLDRACVLADRGRTEEVLAIARDAYVLCRAEGVAKEALTALALLIRAASREEATSRLAERAVHVLIRSGRRHPIPVEEPVH